MIITRTKAEWITERIETIRKMYVNKYPEVEVIYNTSGDDYEVYVDYNTSQNGKPIAIH